MTEQFSNTSILETLSNGMADAVANAAKFTVLVDARKRLPVSGVLIKPDLVVSVDHGIETEEHIQVQSLDDGPVNASLVGRDSGSDLAVLRLEQAIKHATSPHPRLARVGQPVIAVGKPEPGGVQASMGIVTAMGAGLRTVKGSILEQYIATDATPYPGFSGGPLLALTGEVLGLNTSGLVGGLSLAIPFQLVLSVAAQLEAHGKVRRGYLGIRSQKVEIPQIARSEINPAQTTGLLLVGIEPDGPAAAGGLMIGDILIDVESHPIFDQDDLAIRLSGETVGKAVRITVLRGGKATTVTTTIGERA